MLGKRDRKAWSLTSKSRILEKEGGICEARPRALRDRVENVGTGRVKAT